MREKWAFGQIPHSWGRYKIIHTLSIFPVGEIRGAWKFSISLKLFFLVKEGNVGKVKPFLLPSSWVQTHALLLPCCARTSPVKPGLSHKDSPWVIVYDGGSTGPGMGLKRCQSNSEATAGTTVRTDICLPHLMYVGKAPFWSKNALGNWLFPIPCPNFHSSSLEIHQ